MEIHKTNSEDQLNFDPWLQELFDAMKAGKTIKSVTCMAGEMNKEDRTQDFKLKNFHATDYWVRFTHAGQFSNDLVETDVPRPGQEEARPKASFYMSWVREFEI